MGDTAWGTLQPGPFLFHCQSKKLGRSEWCHPSRPTCLLFRPPFHSPRNKLWLSDETPPPPLTSFLLIPPASSFPFLFLLFKFWSSSSSPSSSLPFPSSGLFSFFSKALAPPSWWLVPGIWSARLMSCQARGGRSCRSALTSTTASFRPKGQTASAGLQQPLEEGAGKRWWERAFRPELSCGHCLGLLLGLWPDTLPFRQCLFLCVTATRPRDFVIIEQSTHHLSIGVCPAKERPDHVPVSLLTTVT